ncbi:hypothetical protein F4825DRAFT_434805 [Nemania diffusa]|nr:hypothetical protein F4825DRAFT_434805 [Nemania diffusa]
MLELLLSSGACTTGSRRRYAVSAVALALKESYYTAANLLKESMGWSDEDEMQCRNLRIRGAWSSN